MSAELIVPRYKFKVWLGVRNNSAWTSEGVFRAHSLPPPPVPFEGAQAQRESHQNRHPSLRQYCMMPGLRCDQIWKTSTSSFRPQPRIEECLRTTPEGAERPARRNEVLNETLAKPPSPLPPPRDTRNERNFGLSDVGRVWWRRFGGGGSFGFEGFFLRTGLRRGSRGEEVLREESFGGRKERLQKGGGFFVPTKVWSDEAPFAHPCARDPAPPLLSSPLPPSLPSKPLVKPPLPLLPWKLPFEPPSPEGEGRGVEGRRVRPSLPKWPVLRCGIVSSFRTECTSFVPSSARSCWCGCQLTLWPSSRSVCAVGCW